MGTKQRDMIHFVGIGGTGMSALAEIAHFSGHGVQGSDLAPSPTLEYLNSQGIHTFVGHNADHLPERGTVVFSGAVSSDNVELARARQLESRFRLVHRGEFLAELCQHKRTVAVSGTHGKTTTAAMLTHVLLELGLDPTAALGGKSLGWGSHGRLGKGDIFVAEADESDESFLALRPEVAVITNVDLDHMNHYRTVENLTQAFARFANNRNDGGATVIGWDSSLSREVGHSIGENRISTGFALGADVRAIEAVPQGLSMHVTAVVETTQVRFALPALGNINVANALSCLGACSALGVDVTRAATALESYPGVSRRQSVVCDTGEMVVMDDYAHNPGKISSLLASLRLACPNRYVVAVFQPHRPSRTWSLREEFAKAFACADRVLVTPVYLAGETIPTDHARDLTPQSIAARITDMSGVESVGISVLEQAASLALECAEGKPCLIVTLGAGDVNSVATRIGDLLREKKSPQFGPRAPTPSPSAAKSS